MIYGLRSLARLVPQPHRPLLRTLWRNVWHFRLRLVLLFGL